MCGQVLRQAIRALSSGAEQARCWLWIKRRDITCAPEQQQMMLMNPLEALWACHRNTFIEGCPPDDPVKLATCVYTQLKVLCDSQLALRPPLVSMREQGKVEHPAWPGGGESSVQSDFFLWLGLPCSLVNFSQSLFLRCDLFSSQVIAGYEGLFHLVPTLTRLWGILHFSKSLNQRLTRTQQKCHITKSAYNIPHYNNSRKEKH